MLTLFIEKWAAHEIQFAHVLQTFMYGMEP